MREAKFFCCRFAVMMVRTSRSTRRKTTITLFPQMKDDGLNWDSTKSDSTFLFTLRKLAYSLFVSLFIYPHFLSVIFLMHVELLKEPFCIPLCFLSQFHSRQMLFHSIDSTSMINLATKAQEKMLFPFGSKVWVTCSHAKSCFLRVEHCDSFWFSVFEFGESWISGSFSSIAKYTAKEKKRSLNHKQGKKTDHVN